MTQAHTIHGGPAGTSRTLRALWRRCHALLSPPPLDHGPGFPTEREQARRGRLLGTLLAANIPIAAVQVLGNLPHPGVLTAGLTLFLLLLVLCARLNHRRRTTQACRLFVASQFLVGTVLMAGSAGAQPISGFVAGIFTVLLSGFLVSRRAPFLSAALSAALVAANGLRHPHALPLPPGQTDPALPLIILAPCFFFFMLAVITSLGAGSLEDALARADEADALERRVAERNAALAESRERLHFALKGADLGAWSYDLAAGQATLSEECCRLLGLPPDRALFSPDDLRCLIHPDDRAALHEKTEAAARAGGSYQHEIRIVQPSGVTRWLAMMGRFSSDGAAGGQRRLDGAVMDITERKTMEAEREHLLAEAVARADRDALTGLLNHRAFHRRLDEEADRAQRTGQPLAVAMLDLDNFKFFNDAYGHLAGDDVIRQVAAALQGVCRSYDTLARFGGDEFALLMPGVGVAEAADIAARAQVALDVLGFRPPGHDVAIPLSLSVGVAVFPDDGPTRLGVLEQADQRLYRAKTGGDRAEADRLRAALTQHMAGFPMLDALVTAVDNKDRYTRHHSEDVLTYSLQIAEALGLDAATRHTVAVAALLHDVGKIGVADAVLRKPGALTDEETESVRQHPMMGAVIVGAMAGFEETLDAVRHHHERWDGQGYPFGLSGEECPLIARLMAVADAFSAMTTDRPYRKGMAEGRALAILESGAGTQWDPACVSAFLSARRAEVHGNASLAPVI